MTRAILTGPPPLRVLQAMWFDRLSLSLGFRGLGIVVIAVPAQKKGLWSKKGIVVKKRDCGQVFVLAESQQASCKKG